jgi:Domain of unknown function (DUF222)
MLAHGTHDLPAHVTAEAEPLLVEAARRLDPPRLRRVMGHLQMVADPDGADDQAKRRHARRGLWTSPTLDGMVAIDGLLESEAGQILVSALEPLARPATADDVRSGGQRQADALTELARRSLEAGQLPQTGGVRPQLTVMVDLDSLQDGNGLGTLGGHTDLGALDPEGCRRLARDGAVTRVLITRQPPTHDHDPGSPRDHDALGGHDRDGGLATRLQTAAALLPRSWAAPPASPWTSAGPAGSSTPPNAPPWPGGTGAVASPAVTGPWPGVTPTTSSTGWTAARPTFPTWPCCAGPSIGRSMRAAGN